MVVMPPGEILGAFAVGEGTDETRRPLVLCRWLPRLVVEDTIHRLPYQFRDRNTLPPRERSQPASLVGGELNLSAQHQLSVGTS